MGLNNYQKQKIKKKRSNVLDFVVHGYGTGGSCVPKVTCSAHDMLWFQLSYFIIVEKEMMHLDLDGGMELGPFLWIMGQFGPKRKLWVLFLVIHIGLAQ